MSDRELVAKLEAMARYTAFSPQEAEVCRAASRRIAELNRELAVHLEDTVAFVSCPTDSGGWYVIEAHMNDAKNAARRLVDMGAWEENPTPTNVDTIEVRPVKRVTAPVKGER